MNKNTLFLAIWLVIAGLTFVGAEAITDGYDSPGVTETLPVAPRKRRKVNTAARTSHRVSFGEIPDASKLSVRRVQSSKNACCHALNRQVDGRRLNMWHAAAVRYPEVYLAEHPEISPDLRARVLQDGYWATGDGRIPGCVALNDLIEIYKHPQLMCTLTHVHFDCEALRQMDTLLLDPNKFESLESASFMLPANGHIPPFVLHLPYLKKLKLRYGSVFPEQFPSRLETLDWFFCNFGETIIFIGNNIPVEPLSARASMLPALKRLRLQECYGLAYFFDRLPETLEELHIQNHHEDIPESVWACIRASHVRKIVLHWPGRRAPSGLCNAHGESIEVAWSLSSL